MVTFNEVAEICYWMVCRGIGRPAMQRSVVRNCNRRVPEGKAQYLVKTRTYNPIDPFFTQMDFITYKPMLIDDLQKRKTAVSSVMLVLHIRISQKDDLFYYRLRNSNVQRVIV